MKKIYRILLFFTILCFCWIPTVDLSFSKAYTISKSEIVIEKTSKRILYSHNPNQKLPIASTTKIITALTVIENFDLNKIITVKPETVGIEGSSIYLKEGEKYTVRDLLYGLMLRSGNDCALTLAKELCGETSNFVKLMNKLAKNYGAVNTNFTNPHGLHDDNHYSTAEDLALITCEAMKNLIFKQIVSSKNYTATEISTGNKKLWVNKNKMLTRFDGSTGVKTGFTIKAGRCLVSSAQKNNMEIICVVLNSPQMFERSEELLSQAFNEYKLVKLIDKERFNYALPDENYNYWDLKINQSFYYPIKNGDIISSIVDIPKFLPLNVKKNEKVGKIKIYNSKQLIFLQNIYTL